MHCWEHEVKQGPNNEMLLCQEKANRIVIGSRVTKFACSPSLKIGTILWKCLLVCRDLNEYSHNLHGTSLGCARHRPYATDAALRVRGRGGAARP